MASVNRATGKHPIRVSTDGNLNDSGAAKLQLPTRTWRPGILPAGRGSGRNDPGATGRPGRAGQTRLPSRSGAPRILKFRVATRTLDRGRPARRGWRVRG